MCNAERGQCRSSTGSTLLRREGSFHLDQCVPWPGGYQPAVSWMGDGATRLASLASDFMRMCRADALLIFRLCESAVYSMYMVEESTSPCSGRARHSNMAATAPNVLPEARRLRRRQ